MLADALHYPLNRSDWLRTILVGGLLSVLQILVVPVFLLQGYNVRVLRGASKGDPEPPKFTDWEGLFVDGLKLFAVSLLLAVAVLAVSAVIAVAFGAGTLLAGTGPVADPGPATGGLLGALGAIGFLLFLGFSLLVGYVAPAMFANFAREDSIAAAFDVSTVTAGAMTAEYLTAWVLALVVGLVLGSIASLLSALIVGIFGVFYVQVVTYYLFGRGFAEGLEASDEEEASGEGATTTVE